MNPTKEMETTARARWPNRVSFDFIKCNNCGFISLVPKGDDICPDCYFDGGLEWADDNHREIYLFG